MRETLYLVLGFIVLALTGKLLYVGYTAVCTRLAKAWGLPKGRGAAALLTGFSLCTLFILFIMGFSVAVVGLPLTLGSVLLAGVLILLFDNLLLFAGYLIYRQLNRQAFSQELLRQKRRTEAEYYQALEEQYERQRVLIHDIRKHLAVLGGLAGKGDSASVLRYLEELEASRALRGQARLCGNHTLNVVLCRYQEVCQREGIGFSADVREGSLEFMEETDITALFGNLLENAVEAARGGPSPYLELRVEPRSGDSLAAALVNTCAQPPKSDGRGGFLSRKPRDGQHGLGLRSVRGTLEKYGGSLRQYYEEEAGLFHTVVLI